MVKFGHEYRATIGLIGLMFLFTGLVDALLEDFTLKYFITLSILIIFIVMIIYELIWYPSPCDPWFESLLATLALLTGAFGVHGTIWLYISILLGRKLGTTIWLAPNVIVSLPAFYALTFSSLIVYIGILVYVNINPQEG